MEISSEHIKQLRDTTGISVMQCKKALEEALGDMGKALVILRKRGGEAALKKSDRTLGAGAIGAYVHTTHEVAALVHLSSETDFVAKNQEFIALARDIAMQVAATRPLYISREEVPEAELSKAREVFEKDIAGKPAEMQEKILSGKLDAYFKDQILLEQPYIKDPERTVSDLVNGAIQKFGEKVAIARFERISVK
jgi:elongation factor Ts